MPVPRAENGDSSAPQPGLQLPVRRDDDRAFPYGHLDHRVVGLASHGHAHEPFRERPRRGRSGSRAVDQPVQLTEPGSGDQEARPGEPAVDLGLERKS